ncbi:hypothetical protein BGZ76_002072 [Entomortierella beljakovae]|nr:hypothetical protein BGZ76_002072 [Entomortierella beljakovae]
MTTENVIEKKRGRPLEEFAPARKKVASELMAFEFQSLSLSNPDGSIVHEGADGEGLVPRLYPPVQYENHDQPLPQQQQRQHQLHHHHHQQQRHQESVHSTSHHNHLAQQIQQQRGRAKSNPVGPRSGKENSHQGIGLPSPPLTISSFSQDQHHDQHLVHQNQKDPVNETLIASAHIPSNSPSFSPLSPPISPPPSASRTVADIAMMMDEGTANIAKISTSNSDLRLLGYNPEAGSSSTSSSSSSLTTTSEVKVLNMRQRKWNSVSKEWQEWQEVQCTHTPHLETPQSHTLKSLSSHEESGFCYLISS